LHRQTLIARIRVCPNAVCAACMTLGRFSIGTPHASVLQFGALRNSGSLRLLARPTRRLLQRFDRRRTSMRKKLPPAAWILIAMVVGILLGYMIFTSFPDKKAAASIAGYVSIMSDVFLRLIKMLIGPLVFSTLVVGIAHMGDAKSVGRVFGKALGWFV